MIRCSLQNILFSQIWICAKGGLKLPTNLQHAVTKRLFLVSKLNFLEILKSYKMFERVRMFIFWTQKILRQSFLVTSDETSFLSLKIAFFRDVKILQKFIFWNQKNLRELVLVTPCRKLVSQNSILGERKHLLLKMQHPFF